MNANFSLTILGILVFAQALDCQAQNVYFGNLHSHTSYSDGSGFPEEAYEYARDVAELDFLAITEHNQSRAGRIANEPYLYNGEISTSLISSANRFTSANEFVAIYGQEFSTIGNGNHDVRLDKVLSFTPYSDGIQINKETGRSPLLSFNDNLDVFALLLSRRLREA